MTKATEVKSLGLWLVTGMCVGCGVFKLLSIEHEVNVTKKKLSVTISDAHTNSSKKCRKSYLAVVPNFFGHWRAFMLVDA